VIGSGEVRAKERHHIVELRIPTDHRFGEDQLTTELHVEDATRPWHEFHGAHLSFELEKNLRRQTDSVRACASGNAVFDANDFSHRKDVSPASRVE
jgi:hypothetical protein